MTTLSIENLPSFNDKTPESHRTRILDNGAVRPRETPPRKIVTTKARLADDQTGGTEYRDERLLMKTLRVLT